MKAKSNMSVIKRSVKIAGHATSISLEEPFWETLQEIATTQKKPLSALIKEIDDQRAGNLSSAIRIYVLRTLQDHKAQQK